MEWEWYDDLPTFRLFTHLLLKVNFEKKKWRGIEILPGQIITGRKQLSEETGLSEMQVRTSLTKLKSTNEITIKSYNRFSMITLVSWLDYQQDNQQNNQQATNKQPTDNQQITTTKESKEYKNEKKGERPAENFDKNGSILEVENTAYMSFASIQERMLSDNWINEVIAAKKWNKKTFQRHVFDWLGTKELSGTYQDHPLGRLKEFCIRDYKPDITEQKLVYKKDPHAKYV